MQSNFGQRWRDAMGKTTIDVSGKLMVWPLFVALMAWSTEGKYLPVDIWQVMVPLSIGAGAIWAWLVFSQTDDKSDKSA
ncbi:MAG: hypothetical protein Q8M66_04080, partial [Actinomycetota bacterium]|nr:hypothetical protein [Actinomycetota bacterium]